LFSKLWLRCLRFKQAIVFNISLDLRDNRSIIDSWRNLVKDLSIDYFLNSCSENLATPSLWEFVDKDAVVERSNRSNFFSDDGNAFFLELLEINIAGDFSDDKTNWNFTLEIIDFCNDCSFNNIWVLEESFFHGSC